MNTYLVTYKVFNQGGGKNMIQKTKRYEGKTEKCIPKRIREYPSFRLLSVTEKPVVSEFMQECEKIIDGVF
ncbi:hypothetical protein [Haliscomenobacter hydrossis]|uniref:Uncharacterized protein n=1 Tax=Haliscomenobacter hydrossis (strain ATCC 27775 / DSM 1100 / LMG 10767 / O) TaxID=760192 RepID=F4L085_HALH1|nr:hypothetical protein [Haliscomenobacter hydrossis]AEE53758.1 hypothetical protein Halhy_5935 [Haliscomenobacter hydrossis DSM 1100]